MNQKKFSYLFATSILIFACVSTAQATISTYNVTGMFAEPMTTVGHTTFTGTFNWNAETETVSGLTGTMNVTMWDPSEYPDLTLGYQLAQSVVGNVVTASVFKENTTDVFLGGGYVTGNAIKYGSEAAFGLPSDGFIPNENAYFSFSFDKTTMAGIVDSIVYGDCSPGGLMSPMVTGTLCMTGHTDADVGYTGTMGAHPTSLTISAVPVPAAVWLFGSALAGLVSVRRKQLPV